jgi:HK97 family phage portal protein
MQLAKNSWMGGSWIGGLFGGPPAAGIPVTQDSAMTVSTVYACSQARAETLASLPPMVYRELDSNTRRRDSENAVWRLLHDQPNPHMDSMTFWELMQLRIVNRGFGAAEIVRDRRDRPIELWPLHNSRMEPYRDRNGNIIWRIFTDPSPTSPLYDGRPDTYRYYEIPDRDVFNVPGFNSNGIIGQGVIPCATEEISLALAMTQYGSSWFGRGGRPTMVFEHPGYVDDPEQQQVMRQDLNNILNGRESWHESPIIWDGMKMREVQVNPQQSQFLESKQFNSKMICQFYKTPPAIVQIFDDYKFASVDAMIQQFVTTCLRADAIRIERAVRRKITHTMDGQGKLIALFDDPFVFEFVLEALLRGDSLKQAQSLEIERKWGITNADEWRALNNREPLPDGIGKIFTIAGGTEDLSKLGQTYPSGQKKSGQQQDSGSGNENTSRNALASGSQPAASARDSSQPAFDRNRLYQALENGIPKHHDRCRGGSAEESTTLRDEFSTAAVDVMMEAVQRIESILHKEIEKASNDEAKIAAAWTKHATRLESAILPACKLYCRYRDIDPGQLANTIATTAMEKRLVMSGIEELVLSSSATESTESA